MKEEFWSKLKDVYLKEDKNTEAYELEQPILEEVFTKIEGKLKDIYDFCEPIGRGGAGIVVHLKDRRLNFDRALKIPRPKEGEKLTDSVRSEIEYLKKIRHENIISIYDMGEVEVSKYQEYPYFVMDYVKDAKDLRKKTLDLLNATSESKKINITMAWIANKFYRIARAVNYLHTQHQIIHFDIKPANIFVDENEKPILSDLGFAKKKTEEGVPTVVGFTLFYAHPDLSQEYLHLSSKNRVRKKVLPMNFKYIWDIYAFGKSLLEILSAVDQKFPDVVVYDYTFVYLHLAACRMLDGKNLYEDQTKTIRAKQIQIGEDLSVYKEGWLELDAPDFGEIKYKTFEEICRDFEKLLRGENFLESVPELNAFYPKRIQSSQGIPAPFSKRVKYIIEHPIFSRLNYVLHLGLLNSIYPTATHTRLEHSIGTFRNCCLYIQSLYNDPYNPLFRQLVDDKDIKSILLASILHDLGYYPLAHEIGEVVKELKHEYFTLKFLDNLKQDKFGHSIRDIIENEEWGWGVKLENVKEIFGIEEGEASLEFGKKNLKTKMLSSIIDGPIDADKLDYLLRDSQNCYLKYGELIDIDRLIRNLTVIITKDTHGRKNLTIGTYEKGQSAAESLTFARYLLYQSLYWHHTSRAIRAMLREAVESATKQDSAIKKKVSKSKGFAQDFEELLDINKWSHEVTIDNVLDLIKKCTDEDGKKLIEMIEQRNYYKRMLTIHIYSIEEAEEQGKLSLLIRFRNVYKKTGFQKRLQDKIRESFQSQLYHLAPYAKVSLMAPEKTDKCIEILSTPKKIICDCPEPVYGAGEKDKLRFIPEPQRLQKNYFVRANIGERVSEVWKEVYFKLMNIASKGRVFCHPDIRDTLMAVLGPDLIKDCLEHVINEFE